MDDINAMATLSDIKHRAEKIYKHKKNAYQLIIRELVTNAYHAIIINETPEPKITITIDNNAKKITIIDNGCGFGDSDREAIATIDHKSQLKVEHNLPSKGEGRLVLVHFCRVTNYSSVCNGQKMVFEYPVWGRNYLFDNVESSETSDPSGTVVEVFPADHIYDYFIKQENIEELRQWFVREFFYFFVLKDNLTIEFNSGNDPFIIQRGDFYQQESTVNIKGIDYKFDFFIVNSNENKIELKIIGHHVPVSADKIKYDRRFRDYGCYCYIRSPLFDDYIVAGGLDVKLDDPLLIEAVNEHIRQELDSCFQDKIDHQKTLNIKTYDNTKKHLKYFSKFLPDSANIDGFSVMTQQDFQKNAFDDFSRSVIDFMHDKKEDRRILDSSLHLYVHYRGRIIEQLGKMLEREDDNGKSKSTLENDIHDLLFTRATNADNADEKYYDHNLWLLDDKLAYFSNATSTKNGDKATDIYLYNDDSDNPKEIVLIELKRPVSPKGSTDGHNVGEMIKQIKDYAKDIFKSKKGYRGKTINPYQCSFYGYIIASADDIAIEQENNGNCTKIPFLDHSYFTTSKIADASGHLIHIDLISFKDMEMLAKSRNRVFSNIISNDS